MMFIIHKAYKYIKNHILWLLGEYENVILKFMEEVKQNIIKFEKIDIVPHTKNENPPLRRVFVLPCRDLNLRLDGNILKKG